MSRDNKPEKEARFWPAHCINKHDYITTTDIANTYGWFLRYID